MINKKKAYNYFSSNFELHKSTRGYYRFNFPLDISHDDISGAVNFSYCHVKDHRSGYSKSIMSFIMEYEGLEYAAAKELLETYHEADITITEIRSKVKTKVKLPEGFNSLVGSNGTLAKRARKYLRNRGFNVEQLDDRGFGYVCGGDSGFHGYLIIPFKSKGKLQYYIGRDFIGNPIKYRNPKTDDFGIGKSELLYNEDSLNLYDEVFMTEGWADAESMGDNSIATLGWSISRHQKHKIINSSCKRLVIVPDKGIVENSTITFYQKALQVGLQFIDYKEVYVVDIESIKTEGKDANEIGRDLIIEEYKKTKPLTYSLAITKL